MKSLINLDLKYLSAIYDNIFDEIMILDTNYRIIDVNNSFCVRYNVSKDEILGKYCYNVKHSESSVCNSPDYICPVKQVLNGEKFNQCIHYHRKGNEKRYVQLSAYPIRNDEGDITKIIEIGKDITVDKTNEKTTEKKFKDMYENFPFIIFLLDLQKKIYVCNSVAELYFNRPKKDLINKIFIDLFLTTKNISDSIEGIINNVIDFNLSEVVDFEFLNYSGQESWVELIFSPVKLDNKRYIQVILHDITERKLVENVIKEENKSLRELDQIKKQLMSQISENLKSPLNNIYQITEILLNSYKDQLDQEIIKLLEIIKTGGEKSIDMVGKILNISKIESSEFELNLKLENLNQIINEIIDEVNDRLENKNIILHSKLSEDLYSEIDKVRVKYVINHIISSILSKNPLKNAINIYLNKYKSKGEISIKIKNFKIKNLKSIINLKLSKRIIDLNKGQLIINSERKNKQVEFVINLPLKNWRTSLIHIYIICRSGIPLYDYSFLKSKDHLDASLISGGIIGLISILKTIIQGEKEIKTIDHGDRKLMFETNRTNEVIFVLIVKEDLPIYSNKLNKLISDFDNKYQPLLKNIEQTCFTCDNWIDLELLVNKHFK
ncbi:MAG: PAS domain-containing sensor histidine kinase [Promethearchaeota archaeon]